MEKRKGNAGVTLAAGAVVAAAVIGAGYLETNAEKEREYRKAEAYLQLEQYEDAYVAFQGLDSFKDSEVQKEAAYQQLMARKEEQLQKEQQEREKEEELLQKEKEAAEKAAEEAEQKNQQQAAEEAAYQEAVKRLETYEFACRLLEAGEYGSAYEMFAELGNYGNSRQKAHKTALLAIERIENEKQKAELSDSMEEEAYIWAKQLQNSGERELALRCYELSEGFADSVNQICLIAQAYVAEDRLDEAMEILAHTESEEAKSSLYQIATNYEEEGRMIDACRAYGAAGNYQDCTARRNTILDQLKKEADYLLRKEQYEEALERYEVLLEQGMDVEEESLRAEFFAFLYQAGNRITLGSYSQNEDESRMPVEWRYLGMDDGEAVFLSEKVLYCAKYDDYNAYTVDSWLYDFRKGAFRDQERDFISTVNILSAEEILRYLPNAADRRAKITDYAASTVETDRTYKTEGVWTSTISGTTDSDYDIYYTYDPETGFIGKDTKWSMDSLEFKKNYVRPAVRIKSPYRFAEYLKEQGDLYQITDHEGNELAFPTHITALIEQLKEKEEAELQNNLNTHENQPDDQKEENHFENDSEETLSFASVIANADEITLIYDNGEGYAMFAVYYEDGSFSRIVDNEERLLSEDPKLLSLENIEFWKTRRAVNDYIPVCIDGKQGFMDTSCEIVIKPEWDSVSIFSNDTAKVWREDKIGLIDRDGSVLIEPQFKKLGSFDENERAIVQFPSERYGLIDKNGKTMTQKTYDNIDTFSASFYEVKKDGLYQLIDKNGKPVSDDWWDTYLGSLNYGLARVKKDDSYGFINEEGKLVIAPVYASANAFSDGLALVKKGEKYGYINTEGQEIIPIKYDYITSISEGCAAAKKGSNWCLVYADGSKTIMLPEYTDIVKQFNMFQFANNGKHGIINSEGKIVIEPVWSSLIWLDANKLIASQNGKYGIIDIEGNIVVEPEWDKITDFTGRYRNALDTEICYVRVKKDGEWGILDVYNKKLIEPQWDWVVGATGNLFYVQEDEINYLIDKEGAVVCDHFGYGNEGSTSVGMNEEQTIYIIGNYLDGQYRMINEDGTMNLTVEGAFYFSDSYFCGQDEEGFWKIISSDGNVADWK